jgi:hypothetical protein
LDEKEDMLICCLVCKKWLGILGQEIELKITRSIFRLLNNSIKLYRQPKIIEMSYVAIDNISDDFALILQNCKEIAFIRCTFESSQGLLDTLINCKNVKCLKKVYCSYNPGIINDILICEKKIENAEIQEFHWKLGLFDNDLKFIKTFALLGIQLNKLDLTVDLFEKYDHMEIFEYIKNSYETKLKNLHFEGIEQKETSFGDLFQFLIEWDGLKLDAFGSDIVFQNSEKMVTFVEKQTGLKDLRLSLFDDAINLDKCPTQLEVLNINCSDVAMSRATIMKLSRFKNLRSCNLSIMYSSVFNKKYQFNIPKELVMLKSLTLENISDGDLYSTTPYSPQMEILSVMNLGLSNLTMLHIIQTMPNLKSLEIKCSHGVSA